MDDFLFSGYESGAISIVKHEMMENWGLNDTTSQNMQIIKSLYGFEYPLVRPPYVLQEVDGEFRFAALNTKSNTTHNE